MLELLVSVCVASEESKQCAAKSPAGVHHKEPGKRVEMSRLIPLLIIAQNGGAMMEACFGVSQAWCPTHGAALYQPHSEN